MDPRRQLSVDYVDFWPGLDKHDNLFGNLLSRRFRLEVSDDPELLIFSCYGGASRRFRDFDCLRLFINFENRGWGFSDCDFAITCDLLDHPDHYRFPLFAAELPDPFIQPEIDVTAALRAKAGFASVVVSNPRGTTRNRVHDLLDAHRTVASGGHFRNNVGGPVADKAAFIAAYKFCLAFENSSHPGYTTEKLVDALRANTVPIYWGNPAVSDEFNARRFINYHDFASEEALVRRVIELDEDDDAYCEVLAEPWFVGGEAPGCNRREPMLDWLTAKITDGRTPIAQRRSPAVAARRLADRWQMRRRFRSRVL